MSRLQEKVSMGEKQQGFEFWSMLALFGLKSLEVVPFTWQKRHLQWSEGCKVVKLMKKFTL